MTTKICTGCGKEKDAESDFSWSIHGIKRHSKCKVCHLANTAGKQIPPP